MPLRPHIELRTLLHRLEDHPERVIVTQESRQFVRRTFATLARDTHAAIARLQAWGITPGMRVGIISENSYWWLVHDLALIALRCVSTPFPETDVSPSDESLLDSHELNLLLVSSRFMPADIASRPRLARIDGDNPHKVQASPNMPRRFPARDDDHSYVMGSGTSGSRKGMIASRRGVEAIIEEYAEGFGTEETDSILVFMPLWSLQQRLFYYGALAFGMDLYVVESQDVFQAVRDLKPTILVAPPVFYETLQQQNMTGLFGPQTRVLITGMAKSRPATLRYYQEKHLPLFELYALTETGMVSMNIPGQQRLGSVGKPVPGSDVRISPDGEVLVRKPNFQIRGYFGGVPGGPREWPNGEFWATGDMGHFDDDGFLYVDGRKDDIITTPSGQKIQPEAIEVILGNCPLVRRAVILRDAEQPHMVAIIDTDQRGEDDIARRLAAMISEANHALPAWARIQRFCISADTFKPQNGMLTPNFKLNRSRIASAFASDTGYTVDDYSCAEN